jgi:hypothetical protein
MRFMFAVAILLTGSTPFHLRGDTDIVVGVTIDGHGPFRFLLDTGSSRSAVTRATAQQLARRPTGYTIVVTPSGQTLRAVIPIDRVSLDGGPAASVVAMIAESDDFAGDLDGLIGQDVLRSHTYTIDYRHRRVRWHGAGIGSGAEAPPSGAMRLPLDWQQERFVVSVPQKSNGRALRLVPDSGTDGWVFFLRPNTPLPSRTPLDTVGLRTLSGGRLLRRVLMDRIDVGSVTLTNQFATLVDKPGTDHPVEDGLLPLHLFTRVTLNGPEGYMTVAQR